MARRPRGSATIGLLDLPLHARCEPGSGLEFPAAEFDLGADPPVRQRGAFLLDLDDAGGELELADRHAARGVQVGLPEIADVPARRGEQLINPLTGRGPLGSPRLLRKSMNCLSIPDGGPGRQRDASEQFTETLKGQPGVASAEAADQAGTSTSRIVAPPNS